MKAAFAFGTSGTDEKMMRRRATGVFEHTDEKA
jgi:hypothetical protein